MNLVEKHIILIKIYVLDLFPPRQALLCLHQVTT